MELIYNNNPRWTEQVLQHMQKYADSYGCNFSELEYEENLNISSQMCSESAQIEQVSR